MYSWNIVFTDKEKVELRREPVEPLKEDEVLCKADKSLISIGTESICLKGVFDPDTNWNSWVKYPFYPGYSMAGTVLEVGKNIKTIKPGDRVASSSSHRQYFKENFNALAILPEGVTNEDATWIPLSRVAQNGVRKAQIQMGDRVGVVGLGAVGQLTIQFAKNCGPVSIVGIDPIGNRGEFALESGATEVIAARADQAMDEVKALTNGRLFDVIFDTTGHPTVLSACCKLVRKYGKIVLVGDTSEPSKQSLGPGVVSNFISILGAHGSMVAPEPNCFYPWTLKETTNITLDYILQGRIKFSHLITHSYSPMEAPSVFQRILQDRSFAMGILFDWNKLEDGLF